MILTSIIIDSVIDRADVIGELLRGKFFKQDNEYDVGCYNVFEYRDDVKKLPDEVSINEHHIDDVEETWHCAEWDGIKCRWYWEGDGTLEFIFLDGTGLSNSDCKKDHGWEWN